MKRIIITMTVAFLMLACVSNVTAQTKEKIVSLKKGSVEVFSFPTLKMHVYKTNDLMKDFVLVLEKDNESVIIESPAFWDNFEEFRKYLADNTIAVEAIIPPYHPLGASFMDDASLKNAKVYLTQSTLDFWKDGYGAVMKAGIPKVFGDQVDPTFYEPTVVLETGAVDIAGIKMIINTSYDGFDIEIPEIKTVYVHILGHDTHSEIISREHLRSSIVHLKAYLNKGYQTFLSSHYEPETKQDAETKVAYLEKMETILTGSKTGKEFISNMRVAFPDYKDGYLIQTTSLLFSDFKRPPRA